MHASLNASSNWLLQCVCVCTTAKGCVPGVPEPEPEPEPERVITLDRKHGQRASAAAEETHFTPHPPGSLSPAFSLSLSLSVHSPASHTHNLPLLACRRKDRQRWT